MDLGLKGNKFTWERSRGTAKWIQEQLDQGMANRQWKEMFPSADITVIDVSTSDHLPLSLQLNKKMYAPKTHRFRFENMWLKEKDCLNIIHMCWSSMAGHSIMEKIQFCCLKLEEWGGGTVKEFRTKIKEYKWRLKRMRSRRDEMGVREYNETREAYLKLLERHEIYWGQRAKQF